MSRVLISVVFLSLLGVCVGQIAPPAGIPALADGKLAVQAPIDDPAGVALDSSGNLYFTSPDENRVYRVGPDGVLRLIAGSGIPGYSGDGGSATTARLNAPWGIAVDSKHNVYVADQINYRVRRISPDGLIATFAGNGTPGAGGDGGLAIHAQMGIPHGLAVDSDDSLYISEEGRIRKVTVNGRITTVSTKFGNESIAVDNTGNLYVVGTNLVHKITPSGTVSVVAGNGSGGGTTSGVATAGPLGGPTALGVDRAGNVYIGTGHDRVWKVSNGRITAFAGSGRDDYLGDRGPATIARIRRPSGIAADAKGNVYIADSGNHRVRKVSTAGIIETVAGNGISGYRGDGGPATSGQLVSGSLSVAIDVVGNLYIADQCRVRKVTPRGVISTVAGTGVCGFAGDGGPATAAQLKDEEGIAADATGNLYIADTGNHRIRRVTSDGIITTVAGNGVEGEAATGVPATSTPLRFPRAVAADGKGNIYIADGSLRKVTPNGVMTTVIAGIEGYGGPVTEALKFPQSVFVDSAGNIYVADTSNYRIRKLTPDGRLNTIAGLGAYGFSGDGGPATAAQLNLPRGIAVDGAGNIYIADSQNSRVRKVTVNGRISTIAGNGWGMFGGDGGPATAAYLTVRSIAIDGMGNLYVADPGNRRIRKIAPDGLISTFAGIGPPAGN